MNDLGDEADGALSKFADDTKPGRATDMPEVCTATERSLSRMEKWA